MTKLSPFLRTGRKKFKPGHLYFYASRPHWRLTGWWTASAWTANSTFICHHHHGHDHLATTALPVQHLQSKGRLNPSPSSPPTLSLKNFLFFFLNMGATASVSGSVPPILTQLRQESRQPLDLSDLNPELNLSGMRSEVTRLRLLLRAAATSEKLHIFDLRPKKFQNLILPVPTAEELQLLLESQVATKKILEARRKAAQSDM